MPNITCGDCGKEVQEEKSISIGDGGEYDISLCSECNNNLPEYDNDGEIIPNFKI